MKHLPALMVLMFLSFFSDISAQKNHFVYIQTENKQAFYVKLDKKVFSSSASGYLVVPKLINGTYHFAIGFPKNEWPEQLMVCTIDNKDLGYLLKNFGDKGWGLFNLQTMEVVMSGEKSNDHAELKETKTDPFSDMLSTVVNDPTLKNTEPVKEAPVKESATPVEKKEEVKPVVEEVKTPVHVITKEMSTITAEGTEMVYVDAFGELRDTIRIFMEAEKQVTETPEEVKDTVVVKTDSVQKVEEPNEKTVVTEVAVPVQPEVKPVVEEKATPVAENKVERQVQPVPVVNTDTAAVQVSPMINSDCKQMAGEEDFLKLRKKMAAADNEDEMVAVAKKVFKTKCFTTEQVKNLGVLFLKDAGRYAFFDMAYAFVSDSHHFASLESQLTDPYYISRFRVMIRH